MLIEGSDFKFYVLSEKPIKNVLKVSFTWHNYYLQRLPAVQPLHESYWAMYYFAIMFSKGAVQTTAEFPWKFGKSHQILEWGSQRIKY